MSKYVNEKLPNEQRLGQVGINNQGEKITIIAYRKATDIDIMFEDGTVVENRDYNNFIKGAIKHPIKETMGYYITKVLGINLDDIWNWKKNNENGIDPWKISKGSSKTKVWLYCQEHEYHNWDREGNRVGYEIFCNNFHRGQRCGYCVTHKTHWKDSLAYNYPHVARMIAIPENGITFEDCFGISCYNSSKRFYFKCNECNQVSKNKKIISNIQKHGFSCEFCSDSISRPNKILREMSKQLNLNLHFEYSPKWLESKLLDAYDRNLNIAIEMDGIYLENHKGERKEIDNWKDKQCLNHGIYVIRIDLMDIKKYKNNTLNYIKTQILNSPLNQIYDLSNIDWELAWEESQNSLCVEAWEIYNNITHDTIEISKILGLSKSTVVDYLKRGAECGKCDYTVEESEKIRIKKISGKNHYLSKPIICIENKRIFDILENAGKSVGVTKCAIKNAIKRKGRCKGYRWKYIKINHNKILRGKDISKLHKINQKVA